MLHFCQLTSVWVWVKHFYPPPPKGKGQGEGKKFSTTATVVKMMIGFQRNVAGTNGTFCLLTLLISPELMVDRLRVLHHINFKSTFRY